MMTFWRDLDNNNYSWVKQKGDVCSFNLMTSLWGNVLVGPFINQAFVDNSVTVKAVWKFKNGDFVVEIVIIIVYPYSGHSVYT